MGCSSTVEEFAIIFSNVLSLETCLKHAKGKQKPFVNFKVSTGSCRMFHCDLDAYEWHYTSDFDIYVYGLEETSFSVRENDDLKKIPSTIGELHSNVYHEEDHL
eukprot:Awhi_evm1s7535